MDLRLHLHECLGRIVDRHIKLIRIETTLLFANEKLSEPLLHLTVATMVQSQSSHTTKKPSRKNGPKHKQSRRLPRMNRRSKRVQKHVQSAC